MFIYENNKQVKNEFKKVAIDKNISMAEIARKCDMIPQQLNNRFNNTRLALSDLNEWCNAMGCDLIIEFRKKEIKDAQTDTEESAPQSLRTERS